MGISRDGRHKRKPTGGAQHLKKKKRKFDCGRPSAMTKLGAKRIHLVRTRGGNEKYRALRLEEGNFSWGSEVSTRKARILDVVYNASNNELLRTKTIVKGCIVAIDASKLKQWYETHYGITLSAKKSAGQKKVQEDSAAATAASATTQTDGATATATETAASTKKSNSVMKKIQQRQKGRYLDPLIEEQFSTGRLLACIASRPGQSGRADGYILEGKELEFYQKKIRERKGKKAA
jgi:small subunit ribosomal protein S8e